MPEFIIFLFCIVGRDKQGPAIVNKFITVTDQLLIQINQIGVTVGQQVFFIISIEENSRRAGKRFYQPAAG